MHPMPFDLSCFRSAYDRNVSRSVSRIKYERDRERERINEIIPQVRKDPDGIDLCPSICVRDFEGLCCSFF